jgi:hypothetical protein
MAEIVGKNSIAQSYYELARDELLNLRRANPNQRQFSRALADCYTQLANIRIEGNRDQAAKDLASARDIYEQLALAASADATSQIDWLMSELDCAVLTGFASAVQHLDRAKKIKAMLGKKLPNDPDALYRLACYLNQKEPILSEFAIAEVPDTSGDSDTPLKK